MEVLDLENLELYGKIIIADKGISSDTLERLREQLTRKLQRILVQFANYVCCIRIHLEEKPVDIEDFSQYIQSLPGYECGGDKLMLLSSRRDELSKANTFIKIFIILQECTSFLNYQLFEYIIDTYIIERNSLAKLDYPSKLHKYLEELKISEFILLKPILANISDDNMRLTIVLNIEETCRVSKITNLRKQVARIMSLDIAAIQIHDIGEGSVIVTLLIPCSIATYIFTSKFRFTPQQDEEFQALSVEKMECNGYTYYPSRSGKVVRIVNFSDY